MKRKAIPKRIRKFLFETYGGMCWYCGIDKAEQLDHIIAHHATGDDYILNLAPICLVCHRIKGDRVFCHRDAAKIYMQLTLIKRYGRPITYECAMPQVREIVLKNPSLAGLLLKTVPEQSQLYKTETPVGGNEAQATRINIAITINPEKG